MSRLYADKITLAYTKEAIVARDLSLRIADGKITAIIGPNGCGKSTVLRALARLLLPREGAVVLDGELIQRQPTKAVAKRIGLLPQQPDAPEAITVEDLARRGRYPHQGFMQPSSKEDERAVARALELTDMVSFKDRPVDELSGGQRQRAWLAMALAQETPLLLLDEPTTFLDIAHQVEMLDLVRELNREHGRTVVLVVHDLCHACRYADHLIAMREGKVVAAGPPREVVSETLVREVFALESCVVADPVTACPLVLPRAVGEATSAALATR